MQLLTKKASRVSKQTSLDNRTLQERAEELRGHLGYPVLERDSQNSDYWYLRLGANEEEAKATAPIAVHFYDDLGSKQQETYKHYCSRHLLDQPVMYVLWPIAEGQVSFVLPTEGGLKQRNIRNFELDSAEFKTRLERLKQGTLPVSHKALLSIPLAEFAFYNPIETAKELAGQLAKVAKEIEKIVPQVYHEEKSDGYLHQLLASFQRELLPFLELKPKNNKDYSFADIYAQTVAYALFTARVFSHIRWKKQLAIDPTVKEPLFDRASAWEQLPETNPFLRKLFKDISEQKPEDLGDELITEIANIFGILRAAKMDAILSDFQRTENRDDIIVHFYEPFLYAYNSDMRKKRGVYYTPESVVSYMVRSVDILLKDKFNKPLGLADPDVMILDPATGTGTYLLWIFQLVEKRFKGTDGDTESHLLIKQRFGDMSWSQYVCDHLLPRIFGFELLMAPYAIAHLKLGLFLQESGYQFDEGKRLGIYLVNSLNSAEKRSEILFSEFISEEAQEANKIKNDKPISVVIGNPPYSAVSANLGEDARHLVDSYRYVDGKKIVEKSALQFEKNIQDDYVKFFALSSSLLQKINTGIVSLITNNSFIDSVTLRGMRSCLLDTFFEYHLLDLHGDSDKKETSLDGKPDKNIFDIKQGVAISFMLKRDCKTKDQKSNLYIAEYLGSREEKYKYLNEYSTSTTDWILAKPSSPNYLFKNLSQNTANEYDQLVSITEIFNVNSTGFESGKDNVMVAFSKSELIQNLNVFCSGDKEQVKKEFKIDDGWGLSILNRRDSIKSDKDYFQRFQKIIFCPFDERHTFYRKDLLKTNSFSAGQHLMYGQNVSLVVMRQVSLHHGFSHAFATELIANNRSFYSKKGKASYFPLYLYPTTPGEIKMRVAGKPNIKPEFLTKLEQSLGYIPTPEAIFHYIYAILHSPNYRARYAEFLKSDFPHIPLTRNDNLFRQLAEYGEQLVAMHLMKSPALGQTSSPFIENGGGGIVDAGHPKYEDGKVIINKKQDCFFDVPEAVWNFHVGGYQVCQKWLKDRKGRTLSPDDISHYQKIVVALGHTIELMTKIDESIPNWPIQ